MAQHRNTKGSGPALDLTTIVKTKPRRKRPGNDNDTSATSGLKFRAARDCERKIADLDWQMRFAMMKLHHWRDEDNWKWDSLNAMLERAKAARRQFG